MLSDNFSTEGPYKGTHCKRMAHHKERKNIGASWSLSFQVWSPAQVFYTPKIFNPSMM